MNSQQVVERVKRLPGLRQLLAWRYERYFSSAEDTRLFRGVYGSFAEALASAPPTKALSYDQPSAAQLWRDQLERVRPTDYPVLFWLGKLLGEVSSVFDFGGHVGMKYYAFGKYLTLPSELTWTVCDVPSVAEGGTQLARERGETRLSFVTDFEQVAGKDLLFCSGALHFVEPSLSELLEPVQHKPRHVLVNTTPLWQGPTFYTLHSTGSFFCPYKLENYGSFVQGMQRLGYELVDAWENPARDCTIPGHPERSIQSYRGAYFRRSS